MGSGAVPARPAAVHANPAARGVGGRGSEPKAIVGLRGPRVRKDNASACPPFLKANERQSEKTRHSQEPDYYSPTLRAFSAPLKLGTKPLDLHLKLVAGGLAPNNSIGSAQPIP